MRSLAAACIVLFALCASAQTGDVLGAHDLGGADSKVKGSMSAACLYCHAPHSSRGKGPLWSQTLSSQTYTLYSSETISNTVVQPTLGASSSLCLSCHDGTVATGQSTPYGQINMGGTMTTVLSTQLEGSHPFSLKLPLQDSANLVASLAASQVTADPTKAVQLIKGNLECTSCHNPHNQRIDKLSPHFLVIDNAKGALCLSCHETKPRTVNSRTNPLAVWTGSIHATSTAQIPPSALLGGYPTVGETACLSCHASHNAGKSEGLLRNPKPPLANIDSTTQSCITCHNGGDALTVPIANVSAEFEKIGHPYPDSNNQHTPRESVLLNQNRHATCVDCHNAHGSTKVATFDAAPAVRPSQSGVPGVASDGSVLATAADQYETCLRCHGASSGKQILAKYGYAPMRAITAGDPLNLISQFGLTATSSHPVMRDSAAISQPSLLPAMWDFTGLVPKRPMGTRILCTDCHNSDDNREFGRSGPNGPHGSSNFHILERRYEFSAVGPLPGGGPGTTVTNLNPTPPLGPGTNGPYELCAKCHNLQNVNSDLTFTKHSLHINYGFSCSACHTSHGVPSGVAQSRLVNFDANVVAPYGATPITFDPANKSCTLTCHSHDHNNTKY